LWPAFGDWGVTLTTAIGVVTCIVATFVAFRLAAQVKLGLSQSAATSIVVATLAAGCISAALVMVHARGNSEN
jgi:hypothetical protein